jgi:hypothetical protein
VLGHLLYAKDQKIITSFLHDEIRIVVISIKISSIKALGGKMNENAKNYYTLWAEYLKKSEKYNEIIRIISSICSPYDAPCHLKDRSVAESQTWEDWFAWFRQNEKGFKDIPKKNLVLLYEIYPIFRNVYNPIDQTLNRIKEVHDVKQKTDINHAENAVDFLINIIDTTYSFLESNNDNFSAKQFSEALKFRLKNFEDKKKRFGICNKNDLPSADYMTLVKLDFRCDRSEMISSFKEYLKKGNSYIDNIFDAWKNNKKLFSFAYCTAPVDAVAAAKKRLELLNMREHGFGPTKIANERIMPLEQVKIDLKRAKQNISDIEERGFFLVKPQDYDLIFHVDFFDKQQAGQMNPIIL